MNLAVVLQIIGAALFVAAVACLAGAVVAVGLAGLIVFAAGYAHERAGN